MKNPRLFLILLSTFLFVTAAALAQNKKLDKRLAKINTQYNAGSFEKAQKLLSKFKKKAEKLSGPNGYIVTYHLKSAQISFALGVVVDFEKSLNEALNTSRAAFGETSTTYATTLLDVADNYLEYGNFRMARGYIEQSETILTNTNELNDAFKARIALAKAEAMIGQGYFTEALALLGEFEDYFTKRAVDKETYVEEGEIKTRRVPDNEIFQRFNDYARYKMLVANAYARRGRISVVGGERDNADAQFSELETWVRAKRRYLGEGTLVDIEYRYLWNEALRNSGNKQIKQKSIQLDEILSDLKKKTSPTHPLAHNVYQAYLQHLMWDSKSSRYFNVKLEYERMIDRYYPKTSLHRVNLKAVEFDSKMAKDRTKTLENDALNVISSKSIPKNHNTSVRIYKFLYDVAITEQRFTNAESYLNELVNITADLCGENTPMHHLAKVRLANFYLDYSNKIDEAGKIYKDSFFDVVQKEFDIRHAEMIPALNHIAQWYEYTDNFKLATQTLESAADAARSTFSSDDILLGMELNHIAKLQIRLGDYEAADRNITSALEIINNKQNRAYAEYVPAYTGALETQARLFGVKGLFDEAEDNLKDADKIKRKSGIQGTDELSTASELASLYIQLGRYSDTDEMLDNLTDTYELLYGKNTLRLIDPLVNKGRILLAKGDYTEASNTAVRANQLAASIYGEGSTKAAPTQRLLSDIFYTLGDYEKAEDYIMRALRSQEKQFGRKHIEVAKSISQLSLIKFHMGGNKDEIERLMLESRDIMKDKLGIDNPQYAEILKNVAILYISEGKYDIAFNSLTVAESIWKAKAGRKNNINTASIYALTGDVYYQIKNYKKAEEFYNKAKDLYARFFNKNHPEYVKIISKLSKVAYMEKDIKKSRELIETALDNYEGFIKTLFPALSERQKAKYWNTMRPDFEFYNTLAFSNIDDLKRISGRVYNYQLLTKALLLSSSIKVRERILNSNDETLKAQYNNWVQKKELLTLALSMNETQLSENGIDPTRLQQEVEGLEKELSQKSELFAQNVETKRIQFADVKQALKPNEVAMEFVRYRHFNHSFTDSVIYAVLYLKPEFKEPKAIILKDGHRMETRFFAYYRNAIMSKVHDRVSYGVFWQPIIDEIGQVSTIYLSADGVYNQLNIEAIPTPDGRYVIDNSNIVLVSNTKDIYLRQTKGRQSSEDNTALMFGNPTFYVSATDRRTIAPLPGTEREILEVESILSQKGWNTAEYMETLAAEERIKEVNSPKILHFATHGLYKPVEEVTLQEQIEGNEAVLAQNPLMRTGLLLKGAGDLLQKTDYNYNMENGILTAYEAMSLNLDKTDLVVLSACETGLGKVESGEGVYGLQRAFLNAGAKALVMSMFKVDDVATQKLMQKFYQKWTTTNNLRQSFIDAKKELRVEYPEPIYWGAFMMIGLE